MPTARIEVNDTFFELFGAPSRYKVAYGGRRSGKSYFVSQALCLQAMQHVRKVLCIRKFGTSVRYSTWPRIQEALESLCILSRSNVHIGDREIRLPNGSVFMFSGIDMPEKLKSAEGVTDVWMEEATELSELDFDTIDAGLSTQCDPPLSIWMTFNPIPSIAGARHWLQRRFVDKVPHEMSKVATQGNVSIMRSWYLDNVHCPKATIDLLNSYKEDNPDLYRLWALGEFVAMRNAILDPKKIHVANAIPYEARLVGTGVDFGFSADPATVVSVYAMDGALYVQEHLYATGLTNAELSNALEGAGLRKESTMLTADSAEPKSIRELQQMGWTITGSEKGRDYKRSAANWLRGFHLYITADSTHLLTEAASWSWKTDKDQNALPVVADGNDHCIDALIYAAWKSRGTIHAGDLVRSRGSERPLRRSILNTEIKPLRRVS